MTLTLRIENRDAIENGGPLSFTTCGTGGRIGRKAGMDWVLPDPGKHVSGHHCDIHYGDGHYWLSDISTNGTYLKGQRQRLSGRHRLVQGDRLIIGPYVIVVDEASSATVQRPQAPSPTGPKPGMQTWSQGSGPQAGSPAREGLQLPPRPQARVATGTDTVVSQRPVAEERPSMLQQPGSRQSETAPLPDPPGLQTRVPAVPERAPEEPAPSLPPLPQMRMPLPQGRSEPVVQAAPDAGDAVFRSFCEGAGLDPSEATPADMEVFARDLGRCLRVTVGELMGMLQDKARNERTIEGEEQTMRSVSLGNPMEFLTDPGEALTVLCLRSRTGMMTGPDAFAAALGDLRKHQAASAAALEPALAQFIEVLSAEGIAPADDPRLLKLLLRAYTDAYDRAKWPVPDA